MYLYCLLISFLSLCKFQFYLLIAGVGAGADPAPVLKAFFIQPRGCGVRYILTADYYTCESTIFDRERELAWLEELYGGSGARLVVLYGRRRIGKTELLRRFASGKKAVYFYCERTSARDNLARFRALLTDALGLGFSKMPRFPTGNLCSGL